MQRDDRRPIDAANCDGDCGLTPNGTERYTLHVDCRKLISNEWRERETEREVANSLVDSTDLQTDRAVG